MYTYEYPRPSVTADIVVYNISTDSILLIQRSKAPFKDCYALPGGFVNQDELIVEAAARELKEETSLDISPRSLHFLDYFDGPNRDPRDRVISFAFYTSVRKPDVVAGDDAKDFKWVKLVNVLDEKLAFDHAQILRNFVASYYESLLNTFVRSE